MDKGFKAFVRGARITRTPIGDLVADMRGDTTLPDDFASRAHLKEYLALRGACPMALWAATPVWRRYERWKSQAA